AFSEVADELELLARGMRYTIALRRSDAGTTALKAYGVAKSLNRPRKAPVVPHETNMRRTLGRTRGRKVPAPAAPAGTPATPAAPGSTTVPATPAVQAPVSTEKKQ